MSSELLSRRSLFAAGSALAVTAAATALPAIAKTLPAAAPALPTVVVEPAALPVLSATEPTPIEKLWAKRNAVREQVRVAYRVVHQIDRKAWRRAGAPEGQITYCAANDRLGLERWGSGRRPYIEPNRIEAALRKLEMDGRELAARRGVRFTFSKRQAALRKRLKALLKLSQRHDAKVRGYLDALGYHEANLKGEALLDEQGYIESRILKMPSEGIRDLEIKFALAKGDDHDGSHPGALSIMADMRRLMRRSTAMAQAFGEA